MVIRKLRFDQAKGWIGEDVEAARLFFYPNDDPKNLFVLCSEYDSPTTGQNICGHALKGGRFGIFGADEVTTTHASAAAKAPKQIQMRLF